MPPLMPKATAVWLIDNTTLTFDQVAEFTNLHPLEVKGVADGEVAVGLQGVDPVQAGQLTPEEIARCEADPTARLVLAESDTPRPQVRTKGQRYTPVSKRHDRPAAILWLLRYHPELSDAQVSRLVGTTKPTIVSVRDRTHWNIQQLKPSDPVSLGLCTQQDLDDALNRARKREQRRLEKEQKGAKGAGSAQTPPQPEPQPEPARPTAEIIKEGAAGEPELQPASPPDALGPAEDSESSDSGL